LSGNIGPGFVLSAEVCPWVWVFLNRLSFFVELLSGLISNSSHSSIFHGFKNPKEGENGRFVKLFSQNSFSF
jgi:hypothetical protein